MAVMKMSLLFATTSLACIAVTQGFYGAVLRLLRPLQSLVRNTKNQVREFSTITSSTIEKPKVAPAKRNAPNGDLMRQRVDQTGPNIQVFYRDEGGLVITHGEGVYMMDSDGNRYLDCANNVACVGHSHPAVVKAGCDELRRIQTNSRFLHPTQQRYLSKLLATLPPELDTVYLVNSGSEANDLALRIARDHNTAKKKNHVVCIDHAYHGHTASLIEVSPYKWHQAIDGVNRQPESTHVVSCPDIYRGKFSAPSMADLTPEVEEGLGRLYAQEVEDIVKETGGVGAFIHESVVCCGGQVIPPKGYFKRCYEAVRSAGGVCIADEVQTGFGRPGTSFWAFQEHGVVPDIVTMGKPMGNGYPIAAVVCKRSLANSFAATGIEYFNTYGGNSVACSIAEAVLDTIFNEDLQHNSLVVGSYLVDKLKELSKKYEVIGDVRGMGLFSGVEFIVPPSTTGGVIVPNGDLTKFLVDRLMRERIVVSRDGPDENVIKIKPPLVFNKRNADTLVEGLERALQAAKETQLFF